MKIGRDGRIDVPQGATQLRNQPVRLAVRSRQHDRLPVGRNLRYRHVDGRLWCEAEPRVLNIVHDADDRSIAPLRLAVDHYEAEPGESLSERIGRAEESADERLVDDNDSGCRSVVSIREGPAGVEPDAQGRKEAGGDSPQPPIRAFLG